MALPYPRDEWAEAVVLSAIVTGAWWEESLAQKWAEKLFPDTTDLTLLRAVRVLRTDGARKRVKFDIVTLGVFLKRGGYAWLGQEMTGPLERLLHLVSPESDYWYWYERHFGIYLAKLMECWRDRAMTDHLYRLAEMQKHGAEGKTELMRRFVREDDRVRKKADAVRILGGVPKLPILGSDPVPAVGAPDSEGGSGVCGAHLGEAGAGV